MNETITTYCRMCLDECCIDVNVNDGKITDIRGNKKHPWSEGRICVKGKAAKDWVYSKDRIKKPLKKNANGWEEISLEKAIDEIAEKMNKLKEEYGAQSMSVWKGEATGFNQQEEYIRRFCHAFGTPNFFSCDSICFASVYMAYCLVEGTRPTPDFENSKYIIIWGTNPIYTHINMAARIKKARENGAKLVVIDPRKTITASSADMYVQIKPGTDGALALGIINLIIKNSWYDKDFVDRYTIGFDKLKNYAQKFTPDYVEKETGVSKDILYSIARDFYLNSPRALNHSGNGIEHHENGVNNTRLIASIGALCGCIDKIGGELLMRGIGSRSLTLYNEIPLEDIKPIGSDEYPLLYKYRKECNSMLGIETILSGDPYDIKGMIVTAANPVLTNPNSNKVKKALEKLELLVVRDLFMTETAKLADYILPAASFLERSELVLHSSIKRVGLRKRILKYEDCQDEYEFLESLSKKLGIKKYFPWNNEDCVNKWLLKRTDVSYDELNESKLGIKYGDIKYKKYEKEPFNTPSGKIEFVSEYLKDFGYSELPEYKSPSYNDLSNKDYPYVLVTGARKLYHVQSRKDTMPNYLKEKIFPEVEIHPNDAERLKLKDKDIVRVNSKIGSIEMPVKIVGQTDILPGVIQITHGWNSSNVNLITDDLTNDSLSGFPNLRSLPVSLEKVN